MKVSKALRLLPKEFIKCPMDSTFEIIKQKYVFQIFREMYFSKQTRFSQFLKSIDGINTKTLSSRLRDMEKSGLIIKQVSYKPSLKIEYHLSEKGMDLLPILEQMAVFSIKHEQDKIFGDTKIANFKEAFGHEPSAITENK